MPPQVGSNHGAADVMPQPLMASPRRTTTQHITTAGAKRSSAKSTAKEAGAGTDKHKRPSRSRKIAAAGVVAAPVAAEVGRESPRSRPSSPVTNAEEAVDDGHDDTAVEMRSRLTSMHARYGTQLNFLVVEFTKMEVQLSLEVGSTGSTGSGGGDGSSPEQQLCRLRFFIEHVKRTTDKMEQAKSGLHHYTAQQLDMLEEHITQRLLPVKERMLAQLAKQSSSTTTTTTTPSKTTASPSGGNLFLGGVGGKDDASAVSDGWVVGTSTPALTPPFCDSATGSGVGGRSILSLPSCGASSGMTSSASLPRPCSALSLADLGDLCGDQEDADDCCGGVFLVGGNDCDDVNGSGIGLDLYDLGQGKLTGDLRAGRWQSISTLSSASASTDSEMSDDSLSVDADSTPYSAFASPSFGSGDGGSLKAGAAAATIKTEDLLTTTSSKGVDEDRRGGSCPSPATGKSGIDQEMGELSELFAPDAFLLSTVLDTEMEAAGAGMARVAASSIDIAIEPVTEPGKAVESSAPPTTTAGEPSKRGTTEGVAQVAESAAAAAAAATPAVVKAEYLPVTAATVSSPSPPTPTNVTLPAPSPAAANSTAAASAAATASAAKVVAPKEECRCGEAGCTSLISAARKRPMMELSSSSTGTAAGESMDVAGTPLSMMTGMPYATLQSGRQRKRQRSLTPVLSAPRIVTYECALCKESYPSEIASNPWWSLFLHECPRCHRMQIPRVDATSAAVSVDYIHAVCAEEGEGCDSDGYGSDSCSDSDDDGPDDGREGIAAFDTDVIAGDSQAGCKEGRLSTFQASRLLVLMSHARTCPGRHAKPQHAEVCRSTKFLMLHMRDCNGHGPNGEPCEHRWCRPCKSLLSHLVRCPVPSTCRICTPLDLLGPLRQLRELNVAQARHAAAAAAAAAAVPGAVALDAGGLAAAAPAPAPCAQVATTSSTAMVLDPRCTAVVKAETLLPTAVAMPAVVPTSTMTTTSTLPQQLQDRVVVGGEVAR